MARLAGAYAVSHTAMIIRKYDETKPNHAAVHRAFARIREDIRQIAPDIVIVAASEHMNAFFFDNYPQFCIGIGETSVGIGDGGIPGGVVSVHQPFADHLLNCGIQSGFDFAWSSNMRLDHGFMAPLHLLTPGLSYPIVPLFQNASTPPLPPFQRAKQLGQLIREAIDGWSGSERIVLIGTGGISHWVGTPEMGRINVEFDRKVLSWFENGELEALSALHSDEVTKEAGNGAQEIRNWITVMAAAGGKAEVLAYEPVYEWATGIGLLTFPIASGSDPG